MVVLVLVLLLVLVGSNRVAQAGTGVEPLSGWPSRWARRWTAAAAATMRRPSVPGFLLRRMLVRSGAEVKDRLLLDAALWMSDSTGAM